MEFLEDVGEACGVFGFEVVGEEGVGVFDVVAEEEW